MPLRAPVRRRGLGLELGMQAAHFAKQLEHARLLGGAALLVAALAATIALGRRRA